MTQQYSWSTPAWTAPAINESFWAVEHDMYDAEGLGAAECGANLAELLISLKRHGTVVTATHVCCLAFWAKGAGAVGIEHLSLRPDAATGHFSRKFDAATNTDLTEGNYDLSVPGHFRGDHSRCARPVEARPAHESFATELAESPDLPGLLEAALSQGLMPPCYHDHPVVRNAPVGVPVFPGAIYFDGVKFSRLENAVAFYYYCLLTGKRHLLATLRKSEMCQCGCLGWCSMYTLLLFINWSFDCMARGENPRARHDGTTFKTLLDAPRILAAGKRFSWRFACLFLKCDMMEHGPVLAVPGFASNAHPCPSCHCNRGTVYDTSRFNAIEPPAPRKTQADYDAACRACEIDVTLDFATYLKVRAVLEYDKRKDGSRGRRLPIDVGMGLLKGDRLEPTPQMPNVADFDNMQPPYTVRFWRRANETMARHRNPLCSNGTGISIDNCLQVDWLHCMSLGIQLDVLRCLFSVAFNYDVFKVGGFQDQRMVLSVNRLQFDLFAWYKAEKEKGNEHSQAQLLTPSMFGTLADPSLSLHGAECNGVLRYAQSFLEKYGHLLPDLQEWGLAVGSLVQCLDLIHDNPWVFTPAAVQDYPYCGRVL